MQKFFLSIAGVFGALAVILGAMGAHALEKHLAPDKLHSFETGVRYHFYHSLALVLIALLTAHFKSAWINYAGYCFIIGILFFSGSIYLLSTRQLTGIENVSILGPITPVGGLFFIAGWIFLTIGALKSG